MSKRIKKLLFTGVFVLLLVGITNKAEAWPRFGVVIGPAPVEVVTICPGPNFVWVRGHYRLNIWGNFVWVPGHWARV